MIIWHKTVSSLLLFTYWFVYHFNDSLLFWNCLFVFGLKLRTLESRAFAFVFWRKNITTAVGTTVQWTTVQYSGLLYSRELLKLTTFPLNFHLHYSTCSKWLQDQLVLDQGWYLPSFQLKFSRILSVYSRTLLTLHHWSGMDIAWLEDCREVRNRNGAREAILVTQW